MFAQPMPSYGGSPDVTSAWVAELSQVLRERDGKRPEDAPRQAESERDSLARYCCRWLSTVGKDAARRIEEATSRLGQGYRLKTETDLAAHELRLELSRQGDSLLAYCLRLEVGLDGVTLRKTIRIGAGRPQSVPFRARALVEDIHAIGAVDIAADFTRTLAEALT